MNHADDTHSPVDSGKRDFLGLACGAVGAVGACAAAWPLLDSLRPAADTLALATTEVNLSTIPLGTSQTVMWQGKPVFIRHRTPEEIQKAKQDDRASMPDPLADAKRVERPEWLVVVGICTHLGCIPNGQKIGENKGDYGGWFCPCHGSHYDTSGRIRKGPAPQNLARPPYKFVNDTTLVIG
jgi:ubiquinol-cytochrome c reductase iron-sulfur subunit